MHGLEGMRVSQADLGDTRRDNNGSIAIVGTFVKYHRVPGNIDADCLYEAYHSAQPLSATINLANKVGSSNEFGTESDIVLRVSTELLLNNHKQQKATGASVDSTSILWTHFSGTNLGLDEVTSTSSKFLGDGRT